MAPYNPRLRLQVSPTMMLAFRRRFSVTRSFQEIIAAAGFALGLLASMHAEAQSFEPSLVYMLPVYCKYTQDFRERLG